MSDKPEEKVEFARVDFRINEWYLVFGGVDYDSTLGSSRAVVFEEIADSANKEFKQALKKNLAEERNKVWDRAIEVIRENCPVCEGMGYLAESGHACNGEEDACHAICPTEIQVNCGACGKCVNALRREKENVEGRINIRYWTEHYRCGGQFREIGVVSMGLGDIPEYKCDKCGQKCDATDSEEFTASHMKNKTQEKT